MAGNGWKWTFWRLGWWREFGGGSEPSLSATKIRRAIVRLSCVYEVPFAVYIQERVPKLMIPIGCRNIESSTRADLNEMTARPLTLHAFADC